MSKKDRSRLLNQAYALHREHGATMSGNRVHCQVCQYNAVTSKRGLIQRWINLPKIVITAFDECGIQGGAL